MAVTRATLATLDFRVGVQLAASGVSRRCCDLHPLRLCHDLHPPRVCLVGAVIYTLLGCVSLMLWIYILLGCVVIYTFLGCVSWML